MIEAIVITTFGVINIGLLVYVLRIGWKLRKDMNAADAEFDAKAWAEGSGHSTTIADMVRDADRRQNG